MYIFKLKLSEKARGYCMYVFLVRHLNLPKCRRKSYDLRQLVPLVLLYINKSLYVNKKNSNRFS